MAEPGQYLAQARRSRRQAQEWSLDQASRHIGSARLMLGQIEPVVLLRGEMELLIDGQWKPPQAGDAIRFAADRPHGYRNLNREPAIFHNLIHYPS